mgnify:FL=1
MIRPTHQDTPTPSDWAAGMDEFHVVQAIQAVCYRTSRERMIRTLREVLAEHGLGLIDLDVWRARDKRSWN